MFKIMKERASNYLKKLIPISQSVRARTNCVPTFHCRTDCFKIFFFLLPKRLVQVRCYYKKLGVDSNFQKSAIIIHPSNLYNIFDPIGLKLRTHLR